MACNCVREMQRQEFPSWENFQILVSISRFSDHLLCDDEEDHRFEDHQNPKRQNKAPRMQEGCIRFWHIQRLSILPCRLLLTRMLCIEPLSLSISLVNFGPRFGKEEMTFPVPCCVLLEHPDWSRMLILKNFLLIPLISLQISLFEMIWTALVGPGNRIILIKNWPRCKGKNEMKLPSKFQNSFEVFSVISLPKIKRMEKIFISNLHYWGVWINFRHKIFILSHLILTPCVFNPLVQLPNSVNHFNFLHTDQQMACPILCQIWGTYVEYSALYTQNNWQGTFFWSSV